MNQRVPIALNELSRYVWSTSDASALKTLATSMIRTVVSKYGGTLDHVDLGSMVMNIDVPKENEVACAREVQEIMEAWDSSS